LKEDATSLLLCTDWCDKTAILKRESDVGKNLKVDGETVEKLRNKIAHGDTYIADEATLDDFLHQYELAKQWVERLSALLLQ
jgi:hypothetical protein